MIDCLLFVKFSICKEAFIAVSSAGLSNLKPALFSIFCLVSVYLSIVLRIFSAFSFTFSLTNCKFSLLLLDENAPLPSLFLISFTIDCKSSSDTFLACVAISLR